LRLVNHNCLVSIPSDIDDSELAYQRMPGVVSTQVGYTQGHVPNPTYKEVCTGTTGHTEAIRVVYDPNVVSYGALVQLGIDRLGDNIYKLNQVGNDRGTQYRHGIYYHSEKQKEIALKLLAVVDTTNGKEVVTEIKRTTEFYVAEDYHQQYLMKGGQSAKKGAGETIRCYG
jgi:peptide-methionine (S)-S-oxide reductase